MVRFGLLRQGEVTQACLDVYEVFWVVLQCRQTMQLDDRVNESYPEKDSRQTQLTW